MEMEFHQAQPEYSKSLPITDNSVQLFCIKNLESKKKQKRQLLTMVLVSGGKIGRVFRVGSGGVAAPVGEAIFMWPYSTIPVRTK